MTRLSVLVLALAPLFAASAMAAQYSVDIKDMRFGKAPDHLKAGDTITWTNKDIVRHTATARTGAFDLTLDPGKSGSAVLRKPGRVDVYCRYHPDMTLQLNIAP